MFLQVLVRLSAWLFRTYAIAYHCIYLHSSSQRSGQDQDGLLQGQLAGNTIVPLMLMSIGGLSSRLQCPKRHTDGMDQTGEMSMLVYCGDDHVMSIC